MDPAKQVLQTMKPGRCAAEVRALSAEEAKERRQEAQKKDDLHKLLDIRKALSCSAKVFSRGQALKAIWQDVAFTPVTATLLDSMSELKKDDLLEYTGGCHCQGIRFVVQAPRSPVVWRCNCSICLMQQNHHFIVPASQFQLTAGQDLLALYQFGTKKARHHFCKVCGVKSFYIPRSNPGEGSLWYDS